MVVQPSDMVDAIQELNRNGNKVESITDEDGHYIIKYLYDETYAEEMKERDYRRLIRMERSINKHPDLKRAVMAAMGHEDNMIGPALEKFETNGG